MKIAYKFNANRFGAAVSFLNFGAALLFLNFGAVLLFLN